MTRPSRYSPEVRERAVRMVFDHQGEYDSHYRQDSPAEEAGLKKPSLH